jgi:hypothetical protein
MDLNRPFNKVTAKSVFPLLWLGDDRLLERVTWLDAVLPLFELGTLFVALDVDIGGINQISCQCWCSNSAVADASFPNRQQDDSLSQPLPVG